MTQTGTWDPNQTPDPAPTFQDIISALYQPDQLNALAQALGGGQFPGLGAMQNDTIPLGPDSVAPGFPLNGYFPLPGNLVKNKRVALSFQLSPYRTYYSTTLHSHTGDTIATVNIDHQHGTLSEQQGHIHVFGVYANADGTEPNSHRYNVALSTDGATTTQAQLNTGEASPPLNEHLYTFKDTDIPANHDHGNVNPNGGLTLTSHVHSSISNTGSSNPSLGVQESTSPAGTTVLLDGADVTANLGGPFNGNQFELDLTPYINPAKGYHTVQLTSTQLGRITGTIRTSNIINALAV